MAPTTGRPCWVSFQEMKVANSAISPWAKLRTPVVRKMRTRASATDP